MTGYLPFQDKENGKTCKHTHTTNSHMYVNTQIIAWQRTFALRRQSDLPPPDSESSQVRVHHSVNHGGTHFTSILYPKYWSLYQFNSKSCVFFMLIRRNLPVLGQLQIYLLIKIEAPKISQDIYILLQCFPIILRNFRYCLFIKILGSKFFKVK